MSSEARQSLTSGLFGGSGVPHYVGVPQLLEQGNLADRCARHALPDTRPKYRAKAVSMRPPAGHGVRNLPCTSSSLSRRIRLSATNSPFSRFCALYTMP